MRLVIALYRQMRRDIAGAFPSRGRDFARWMIRVAMVQVRRRGPSDSSGVQAVADEVLRRCLPKAATETLMRAAEAKVRELPPTPGEIASLFMLAGIKGRLEEPEGCPLAVWLGREFPGAFFAVDGNEIRVRGPVAQEWDWDDFDAPNAVCEFVSAFDEYRYPELIDRKAQAGCVI